MQPDLGQGATRLGPQGVDIEYTFPAFYREFALPDASGKNDLVLPQACSLDADRPEAPLPKGGHSRGIKHIQPKTSVKDSLAASCRDPDASGPGRSGIAQTD